MELTDWLRAQLDEDEGDEVHYVYCASLPEPMDSTAHGLGPQPCDCGWPERLRAEVEAKRLIIARAEQYTRWAANEDTSGFRALESAGALMVKYVALPYANRPGYREEWRP